MFEVLFDLTMWGGLATGFAAGWLGPSRPEKVTTFYHWLGSKLQK